MKQKAIVLLLISSRSVHLSRKGPKNLAPEKRFYLEVIYPQDSKKEPTYFYFDEAKRYGVVLDTVADHAKIRNRNNVSGAEVFFPILLLRFMLETASLFFERRLYNLPGQENIRVEGGNQIRRCYSPRILPELKEGWGNKNQ